MQIAFLVQLTLRKNVLYVPTYYRYIALKQLAQLRLRQPHRLVFKTDGEPDCVVRLIDDDFVLGLRQITRLIVVRGNTSIRSVRLAIRAEPAEDFGEAWRQALEKILAALADVIPRANIVPAHNSITPGACSRGALRTDLLHDWTPIPFVVHDWTPIPFVVSDALRGRTTAAGYNAPMTHFRNRRCLASCRRRLGRASRAQARGGSLLHRVPNRPPRFPTSTPPPGPSVHPSGFSIHSQQGSIGFNPTAFKAPVRTSVATEFNSGEH